MGEREDLEELRAELREAFLAAPVAVKAQVAGQLRAVIKDLAALGVVGEEVSAADEIAARREARRPDTADRASSSRRSQPRRRGGNHRSS